jgi:predicted metalloprotease with PDZ domain
MRKLALVLLALPVWASADVAYTLTPNPAAKTITVTVTPDQSGATETFRIPAWCPGFYTLKNFETKVFDVAAAAEDGTPLKLEKVDSRGWRVQNPDGKKITLSYKVMGDDPGLGFFGVNVREDKAFVNGAAGFMYVDGKLTEPTRLTIKLPNPGWNIATGMTRTGDTFLAGGYDELIDHPIQLGTMARKSFKIGEYDFEVVFASVDNRYRPNLDKQVEVIRKVAAPAVELFRGAPFKRYVFIFHLAVGDFSGGLEHRASTTISVPNDPNLDMDTLVAHEFFHTWNVKNIRPKVLGPFDYTTKVRTGNLWFAEGTTDYYAKMNTYRGGLHDPSWLLNELAQQIQQLQGSSSRRAVTLEEACRRTWESSGFGYGDLDYYNKGLVAGLLLDASIRQATQGQKSLDDVMRLMYDRYRLPKPGYEEDGIRLAINEVAGKDLSPIYNRILRSTQEVPYEQLSGIGLRLLAPGATYTETGFATVAGKVWDLTQEAYDAGLRRGDEVLGATLSTKTAELAVRRDGEAEFTITVPIAESTAQDWRLEENPLATKSQRKLLASWMKR